MRALLAFPCSRAKTTTRSFLHFPSSAPFFSRVLPTSKLLFRARLYTCRRASAVVRWVPSYKWCCATSTALAAAASTLATTTRISTSLTFSTTRHRAQVLTTRGALQSRARHDRCCARVVARLPHPSGNKPRRQNWAKDLQQRAQHPFFLAPPPTPPPIPKF